MEKVQSAVTWLLEEFDKIEKDWEKDSTEYSDMRSRALELAEYMFQEQIEKTWENGYEHGACVNEEKSIYHGNQYFKKTFKSE